MYKELVLKLNKDRPIFKIGDITCMYDSGAMFPVWCASLELLLAIYPNAEEVSTKFLLSGFGGKGESASVYRVDEFKIHEDLIFKNMHMAVSVNKIYGCDLILSDTMFDKMKCAVNRLNVNGPTLEITVTKNEYWIVPKVSDKYRGSYSRVCNFTQQEQFDKSEYLKEYLEYLPEASFYNCNTKEDCDNLLERLGLRD